MKKLLVIAAIGLFGGHVAGCPQHGAPPGLAGALADEEFSEAEVGDLGTPGVGAQNTRVSSRPTSKEPRQNKLPNLALNSSSC